MLDKLILHAERFIMDYEEVRTGKNGEKRKNTLEKEVLELEEMMKKKEETRKQAIRKGLENPDDMTLYASILDDLSKEVKTLEIRKKELFSELQEYKERQDMFEAIRDTSERYKKGIGKIEEKDRVILIRKFIEKIIVEKENIRVVGRIGKVTTNNK
jgi:hypothetical protein